LSSMSSYSNYDLREFYCKGGKIYYEDVNCEYGCKDGACLKEQKKSITVTSPNGGEEWDINKSYNITWDSCGLVTEEMVKIVVSKRNDPIATITKTRNTGSYTWNISETSIGMGQTIPTGDYYKIEMCSIADSVCDSSDDYFSIVATEVCQRAAPTVTINPASSTHNAGDYRGYGVFVKNNDSSECSSSVFDLTKTCPSGWTCNLTISSMTIAPGQTYGTTLGVTSPKTASSGTYNLSARAVSRTSQLSGSKTANYVIESPSDEETENPVSGTLSANKTTVKMKENIVLTVTGKDKQGVKSIHAHYQGKWHSQNCRLSDNTLPASCTKTFNFSESSSGTRYYYGYVYGTKINEDSEGTYTKPSYVTVTTTAEEYTTETIENLENQLAAISAAAAQMMEKIKELLEK